MLFLVFFAIFWCVVSLRYKVAKVVEMLKELLTVAKVVETQSKNIFRLS